MMSFSAFRQVWGGENGENSRHSHQYESALIWGRRTGIRRRDRREAAFAKRLARFPPFALRSSWCGGVLTARTAFLAAPRPFSREGFLHRPIAGLHHDALQRAAGRAKLKSQTVRPSDRPTVRPSNCQTVRPSDRRHKTQGTRRNTSDQRAYSVPVGAPQCHAA